MLSAKRETKGIIDGFFSDAKRFFLPVIYEGEKVGRTSSQLKSCVRRYRTEETGKLCLAAAGALQQGSGWLRRERE